ncbi:MAG: ThuA domain-containing protein [Acidimicrobiia bacterium]|jgi:type 1 glutamine amidotransferase
MRAQRRPTGRLIGFVTVWAALLAPAACSAGDSGSLPATTSTTQTTTTTVAETLTTTSTTLAGAEPAILVFHRTAGFRHDSIPNGIAALTEIGEERGFSVVATEDPSVFTGSGLAEFGVIVFMNTTRDVLDAGQQAAMESHITAGHGFVGIHAAADTEYEWPWYGGLVGAYFDGHPEPQQASVRVVDSEHPVVRGLPVDFRRFDEWYDFRSVPEADVTILMTLDETSYEGGGMGENHPIAWAHEYDGGRSVYIGFGHTGESYSEPLVVTLLTNAIEWAAGVGPGSG